MAGVIDNRNSPFSPFSVESVTEILRSPYRGEEKNGGDEWQVICPAAIAWTALQMMSARPAPPLLDGLPRLVHRMPDDDRE